MHLGQRGDTLKNTQYLRIDYNKKGFMTILLKIFIAALIMLSHSIRTECMEATPDPQRALNMAANDGSLQKVITAFAAGAHVNGVDGQKFTALDWACLWGHDNVVGELLRRGAEVHRPNGLGNTPLYTATLGFGGEEKTLKVVRLLLAAGAEVNIRCPEHLETPLYRAAFVRHYAVMQMLTQAGACPFSIRDKLNLLLVFKDKPGVLAVLLGKEYVDMMADQEFKNYISSRPFYKL